MTDSRPRILYVITDLLVGGVPLHLCRLAIHVRNQGFEPVVVSLSEAMPAAGRLIDAGIAVESCGGRRGWDVRVLFRLADAMRAHRPDIVHAFLFHANVASRWAARRVGIASERVVCEIQTVEVERRWHLWADRFTYEGCRFTIGNSPSVIEHLHQKARIPPENLRLVRGGIDVGRVERAARANRSEIGVPEDVPLLLWVGRLDPVKGLFFLLESFQRLLQEMEAHLVLVGDGLLRGQLTKRIQASGLSERVHLLGSRDDVPSLLKSADLFVFPSRTEGLPNALLEAMAAGCAIVATNVPGCRDLITNECDGLVVPYSDTGVLTSAMLRLLKERALAKDLGTRANQNVSQNWRIDQTYAEYLKIYREVPT